jgi:hypothetical protein
MNTTPGSFRNRTPKWDRAGCEPVFRGRAQERGRKNNNRKGMKKFRKYIAAQAAAAAKRLELFRQKLGK